MRFCFNGVCCLTSIFFYVLMGISSVCIAQGVSTDSLQKLIDEKVESLMEKGNIPGVSLVYLINGKAIHKTYGYADADGQTRVTNETLFELGSCTKAFTGLAIRKLESEQKLSLSNRVSNYLPSLVMTYEGKQVDATLSHLLFHTSGISKNTLSHFSPMEGPEALRKTIASFSPLELNRHPGVKFEYASLNYDILGRIIEMISGQSFDRHMRDAIFRPLGMN